MKVFARHCQTQKWFSTERNAPSLPFNSIAESDIIWYLDKNGKIYYYKNRQQSPLDDKEIFWAKVSAQPVLMK